MYEKSEEAKRNGPIAFTPSGAEGAIGDAQRGGREDRPHAGEGPVSTQPEAVCPREGRRQAADDPAPKIARKSEHDRAPVVDDPLGEAEGGHHASDRRKAERKPTKHLPGPFRILPAPRQIIEERAQREQQSNIGDEIAIDRRHACPPPFPGWWPDAG